MKKAPHPASSRLFKWEGWRKESSELLKLPIIVLKAIIPKSKNFWIVIFWLMIVAWIAAAIWYPEQERIPIGPFILGIILAFRFPLKKMFAIGAGIVFVGWIASPFFGATAEDEIMNVLGFCFFLLLLFAGLSAYNDWRKKKQAEFDKQQQSWRN